MLDDSYDSEDEDDTYKIPARRLMAAALNSYVAWDSTVALGGSQQNFKCALLNSITKYTLLLRPS